MDPVTHILAGGLAGQAVRPYFRGKAIVPFGMAAAWLPDIDNFISGDPEFYLLYHRAFTHSIFGGLLIAVLFAGAVWIFKRGTWRFPRLFAFAYGCVLLHVFLDWINTYGTQVFAPFSTTRYALGSVFILDPLLTGALLVLFLVSLFASSLRKPAYGLAALGFSVVYPFTNHGVKTVLEVRIANALEADGVSYEQVHLDTDFLTPFRWKLIVETEDDYLVEPFHLFRTAPGGRFEVFRKADREKLRRWGEEDSFFATWEWFAVYPVVEEREGETGRVALHSDLRFRTLHPWSESVRPPDLPAPFSLEVELNEAGEPESWRYFEPVFGLEGD